MTEGTPAGINQFDSEKYGKIVDALHTAIRGIEGAAAPPGELIAALGMVLATMTGVAINATLESVIAEAATKAEPSIPTDEDDNPELKGKPCRNLTPSR